MTYQITNSMTINLQIKLLKIHINHYLSRIDDSFISLSVIIRQLTNLIIST